MKKKLLKFFIIIGALTLLLTTISNTQVKAVTLQANPNTNGKNGNTAIKWMPLFREMEKEGGALGLSETIDKTTLLSTSGSNNLDSHLVKSTEYGAAAILSASGYGNPKMLHESTIKTTTGNETGVYFINKWINKPGESTDVIAAGLEGKIFPGVDPRYYDTYTESITSARVGDAMGTADTTNPGCAKWHSSSYSWFTTQDPYLWRGIQQLFTITTQGDTNGSGNINGRGVVVCGEGL